MTFKEYGSLTTLIMRILKKKFSNLSVEETHTLATDILNEVINALGIKQE